MMIGFGGRFRPDGARLTFRIMFEDLDSKYGRLGPRPYGFRLDTLIRLRWLAVAGQTLALVVVHWGFGFALPIWPALAIVALTVATNVGLRLRYPGRQRVGDQAAGLLLAFDVVQLALLLYFTGGIDNPFSVLFLAPVLISATALSARTTLILAGLTIAAVSLLGFFHHPLPWYPGEQIVPPPLYQASVWISLVLAIAFIGGYALTLAKETRQLSDALAAAELVLAREQHLSALDGLAAAAAHELGTPLATIALVVRELERTLPASNPYSDDIKLLREQTERCRNILRTLASLRFEDAPFDRMPLSHLLEEVVTPHRPVGTEIKVELPLERASEPILVRNPAILYGLGNLVENAVDFARSSVALSAQWDNETVTVAVTDDGPGFASEVIDRIGEPYVTARNRRRGGKADGPGGLGLGFFIAKTLLERTGAAVSLQNRVSPKTGAIVEVRWPRRQLEFNVNSAVPSPIAQGATQSDTSLAPQ
jgi:two-component system sensor histidine kinase RegB